MKKIKETKRTSGKQLLMAIMIALGITVTAPAFAAPVYASTSTSAEDAKVGDDLFVDDKDDAKTEDISNTDIIVDNVVQDETKKEETKKEEETKEEETKKNDKNECITPDNNYEEGEGEYWDENIKTEEEKKNLKDTPEDKPTPKTGVELSLMEIMALLGSCGLGLFGVDKAAETIKANKKRR